MPERYRVVLQGFDEAERRALAPCFELAPEREPSYAQVSQLWESDYIVADTADTSTVTLIMQAGRLADTVFVGPQPVAGALVHVARPIDPVAVVRALDELSAVRATAGLAETLGEPPPPAPSVASADAVPAAAAAAPPAAPRDPKAAKARARAAAAKRRNAANPTNDGGTPLEALVLDDSPVAVDYLRHLLDGLGLRVHAASSSAEALELLTHQPIHVALLDIALGDDDEFDGLDICQRIKHEPLALAGGTPIVVLVSGEGKASDRVRATLAGADAYLTKPFSQQDLVRALESCGLTPVPTLSAPLSDAQRG